MVLCIYMINSVRMKLNGFGDVVVRICLVLLKYIPTSINDFKVFKFSDENYCYNFEAAE